VSRLHDEITDGLAPARDLPNVADVRTLGAIGVIELHEAVDLAAVQPMFVERGVWVRPFGKLVYTMPPFVMGTDDVAALTAAMVDVVAQLYKP
jgi:adenosylmethionine-8-amino-7-oxononanoate aminotransferase